MQWNKSYYQTFLSFYQQYTSKGWNPFAGFRSALTRTVNNAISNIGMQKKDKVNLTGEDAGKVYLYSFCKSSRPKFSSQTKDKLVS